MIRTMGVWLLAPVFVGSACLAQANFSESFENLSDGTEALGGPPELVSRGWQFRNQSLPVNSGISPYWTPFNGWGQSGAALGHGGFAQWFNSSSKVSAWMILPAIPNLQAGDPFSVWTMGPQDAFGNNNATIEIRYSPTGATGTGSGPNEVGSFTTLLASASGTHAWTKRSAAAPGNGRFAIRMTMGPGATSQAFNGSMMIDALQVGTTAVAYPLPSAGQTVHWTTAHSPVVIQRSGTGQNPLLVAGGTVVVDPGVEVRFASGASLEVAGVIQMAGAAAGNVRLRGPGSLKVLSGGRAEGTFVDSQAFTDVVNGARVSYADSAFSDPSMPTGFSYDSAGDIGARFFGGNLDQARQVVSLARCTFGQGCSVTLQRGWLAARDCTFTRGQVVTTEPGAQGGEAMYLTGASILKNVTVDEGYIELVHDHLQHRYVGDVDVSGNPHGPGIRLSGGASYLIDPSVTLQNNVWPVAFGFNSAGLLPGTALPTTGNQLNEVPDTDDAAPLDQDVVWADPGIPYVVWTSQSLHGKIRILPGVTVKLLPNVTMVFDTDSNGFSHPEFLGEPERPILFTPYTPGSPFSGVTVGGTRWFGQRFAWCTIEGSTYGLGLSGMPLALDHCTFRGNHRALYSESRIALRGCLFENNVYSYTGERFAPLHEVRGFLDANHPANPNSFINNNGVPGENYFGTFLPNGGLIARARHNSLENTDSDVRNNWWGTPTGPKEPRNPGGTGDAVFFGIDAGGFLLPFLTQAPVQNPSPVVRFVPRPLGSAIPGETIAVYWTARDDGAITAQRVYYSPDSNSDAQMQLLATLPAGARSFAWTVPAVGTPPNGADQFLRVVAVDNLGQEGIADLAVKVMNPGPFTGTMTPTLAAGQTFRPGELIQACATASGVIGSPYAAIELDNDETGRSLGGAFGSGGQQCTILGAAMPDVSTDRARIRFDATASLNQVKSFYSPYFSIRPDAMLGDAPPQVALTGGPGASAAGGSTVSLAWTASDDEGLRAFDIRASYDGGTRWFVVARDLPGTARTYAWVLPATNGIPQVKVRVVAKDLRFQNTSAESGVFAVTAGTGQCYANCDGSTAAPILNVQDFSCFLNAFASGDPYANCDGSTAAPVLNIADFGCFLNAFAAGCP